MFGIFNWGKLSPWQSWGLASGGVLTEINNDSFSTLGFDYAKGDSDSILSDWWGVHSRENLLEKLRWLFEEGHNGDCQVVLKTFSRDSVSDPVLHSFITDRFQALEKDGLVAWDMMRLVNVARWGYNSKYLSSEEAWGWIHQASVKLRSSFDSWSEAGDNFLLGYQYWDQGNPVSEDWVAAKKKLVASKKSPWRKNQWNIDLRR